MLKNETSRTLPGLEIGTLEVGEMEEAVGVLARGMRDNPLHLAVFGEDLDHRFRGLQRFFGEAAKVMNWHHHMLVARNADDAMVGVCGALPPGRCLPNLGQQLRMLPRLLQVGTRAATRSARWLGVWAAHDLQEAHWHLGPLAVDMHLQGTGIGSQLMRVFCARMDAAGEVAYLETDKPINVRFYERFGFQVVGQEEVLSVPNWFMCRPAKQRK